MDEKARDQFVIRAGTDTEVLWNDARHMKPEPVYKRTVSRQMRLAFVFNTICGFIESLVFYWWHGVEV